MKTVYQAANITEAEIVRGMLAAEGISSHVTGFYLQGGIGELAPTDTARVLVEDADLQRALTVLDDYSDDAHAASVDEQQPSFLLHWLAVLALVGLIAALVFLFS